MPSDCSLVCLLAVFQKNYRTVFQISVLDKPQLGSGMLADTQNSALKILPNSHEGMKNYKFMEEKVKMLSEMTR